MNMKEQDTRSRTIVCNSLRRPTWVRRSVIQNVVLVRDRSGSMSGQKAKDASSASLDLVTELAEPVNKDGFNVAIVDFSGHSKIVHNLEKATALNGKVPRLSIGLFDVNTNITAGLKNALWILEKAERRNHDRGAFLRPVVIVFTDGCHNKGPDPNSVANRLKGIADIVAVAFGDDADEGLMLSLASTPQHFYRCSTGRELRSFLAAVGTTMTATMAAGTNATQALTTIRQ